ncbi:phage tail protein [Pantanalinema rosaneae CENA516]|uniref:phage tail protein n=1 Tax=Pantanalinema rosaneae TaxID=1620701 RepID=UPI003D6F76C7
MPPTHSNQVLRMRLLSMQIPEETPSIESDTAAFNLVLLPGEAIELVVQLENLSDRSLEIDLRLDGECPLSWYRLGLEGRELRPGQRMDAVIVFQVPANFFEDTQALRANESLGLNYRCQVVAAFRDSAARQQRQEYAPVNLCVRSRSRYLQFLPLIYREVDFIGRFLKIFEQAFDPVVQSLAVMWANLDPLTAPESMLPFLAHWVAWDLDSRWSPLQQRRLIRNAMEIYRWRGTRRGLRLFLHLYTDLPLDDHLSQETDKHICIEEATYKPFMLGSGLMGQDTALGHGRPFHFTVRLRLQPNMDIDEQLVHYIIQKEKPAFCTYELFVQDPSATERSDLAIAS